MWQCVAMCRAGEESLGLVYFFVGPFLSIFKHHVTLGPVSYLISLSGRRPVRRACNSMQEID